MRLPLILAAIVQIQPIVSEDVLEPSVRNEVDHALSLAAAAMSTNSPTAAVSTPSPFAIAATNSPPAASTPSPFAIAATNSPTAAASTSSPIAQPTTNAFAFVASPTNAVPGDIFGTNGLSATEIAIKLVSSQRADGRWLSGTNDVTAAAIQILLSL
ncbi:MAG: hypothetical protein IJI54_12615 [Kiritimatiellae bacterium]|nr:hypothetical protein [Kiritimatiellia bacterium]